MRIIVASILIFFVSLIVISYSTSQLYALAAKEVDKVRAEHSTDKAPVKPSEPLERLEVEAIANATVENVGDYSPVHFVVFTSLVVSCFLAANQFPRMTNQVACLTVSIMVIVIAFYLYSLVDVDADDLSDTHKIQLQYQIICSKTFEGLTLLLAGGLFFEQFKTMLLSGSQSGTSENGAPRARRRRLEESD